MGTFSDGIIAGLRNGRFKSILGNYCLQWRENPTQYVIANAVAYAVEGSNSNKLYEMLTDKVFRNLKKELFGTNGLRTDLQTGLDFFSKNQPDLLRYIQLLFLELRTYENRASSVHIHEKYCYDYMDFFQLNVPLQKRRDIGIHRVLNRVFPVKLQGRKSMSMYDTEDFFFDIIPMDSDEEHSDQENLFLVHLVDYTIGIWQCKCGALQGHEKRFNFSCKCGRTNGNGLLDEDSIFCSFCGQMPNYEQCVSCGTRVTLDLIWRIQKGNIHPSELTTPLSANLIVKQSDRPDRKISVTIGHFPLMLGIRERKNNMVFEIPDLFWLESSSKFDFDSAFNFFPIGFGYQLFRLNDSVNFHRQRRWL